MQFAFAALAMALAAFFVPLNAQAQDYANARENIVQTPNAPVVATRCKSGGDWSQQSVNVVNRSHHSLLNVTIEFRFYDTDGVLIGKTRDDFSQSPAVASGDEALLQARFNYFGNVLSLSEPSSAIGRGTCKVVAAQFTGLKKWTDTQKWGESLLPLQQQSSQDDSGATVSGFGAAAQFPTSHPKVGLAVSNAWNDTVQGALFIHCDLTIQGGSSDTTLTPNMLTLTMQLANGAKKIYGAMTQAAPTYQKINPLGQTTQTAYEVDPKDDLGAIGSIIVPAHGTVHIIATFFVGTDVLADPNANRQVAFQ